MLQKLRKFSGSVFAKVFLAIVAIPFIFWGMGDLFSDGNQRTIVKIDKEKVLTKDFVNYINNFYDIKENINTVEIENLLTNFIGRKLIQLEIEKFNINITEKSLAQLVKSQEIFRKENKFSRNEYEKFLIKNSINAVAYEKNLSQQEKKKQVLEFIGGGIESANFLTNIEYDKINQKRNIQLINLNDVFKKDLVIEEDQIQSYFDKNKDSFIDVYKSIKFFELNPNNLIGTDEFNDLFFKKIDEIDDLIANGHNLDYLREKFNLDLGKKITLNKFGKNKNFKSIENFPNNLIDYVFKIETLDSPILYESDDKYFIIELNNTERIQKKISDEKVNKNILLTLKKERKRTLISELIMKINMNNFKKNDFDAIASTNNLKITKVRLNNRNDDKVIKKDLIEQVYLYPAKQVIIITDIGLSENFLVYIDEIENVSIDKKSSDYEKYAELSKVKITTNIFNTYDQYIRSKYKIKINRNTLENVKNYF